MQLYSETLKTPTGEMQLLTDANGAVRALEWTDLSQRRARLLKRQYPKQSFRIETAPAPTKAFKALADYFDGKLNALEDLAVIHGGTPFQREVWTALRTIPVGQTVSYGDLAQRIKRPKAVRALGLANGANPIGIITPCHRVIGRKGALTGYGGGLERKRWLLTHEGALTPQIV